MRRPLKKRHIIRPDRVYNSEKLARFINYVMLDGKKTVAERIVYDALLRIKDETGNPNPLEVFDVAIKNASPHMEVRSRRVGGANYQVPVEVRPARRLQLSMRWILNAAREGSGTEMSNLLANELIAASKGEGKAVKKKDDTHRMAEANKAFAHFAW